MQNHLTLGSLFDGSGGFPLPERPGRAADGRDRGCDNTLRAESHHPPLVFENHSQDSRYTGPLNVTQAVSSTFGMDGNNQPFVVEMLKTLKIRSGCEGALIQDDKSATLGCNNDQMLFVPIVYGICSKDSNAMKSSKPHSGITVEYMKRKPHERLTPAERARLQGFPDWWCNDPGTEKPTEEDIAFWTEVFETHRKVMGTSSKSKTRNQIINWIKELHSDFAEYKMWGNGVALPCVVFVLSGIVYYSQFEGE